MTSKFGYDLTFLDSVKGAPSKGFSNLEADIMGVHATLIDFTYLDSALVNIRPWIQSFIYFMLLLYHINSLYKLIRGTSLIELKLAEVNIHNSINEGGYK